MMWCGSSVLAQRRTFNVTAAAADLHTSRRIVRSHGRLWTGPTGLAIETHRTGVATITLPVLYG